MTNATLPSVLALVIAITGIGLGLGILLSRWLHTPRPPQLSVPSRRMATPLTPRNTGSNAIDTVYRGHLFRSRLEARWAVFLHALDTRYEYEPEGFDLQSLRYVPAFRLPNQRWWLEITSGRADDRAATKARHLAAHTGMPVALVHGEPLTFRPVAVTAYFPDGTIQSAMFAICPACEQFGIHVQQQFLGCVHQHTCVRAATAPGATWSPHIIAAYTQACQAQFAFAAVVGAHEPLRPASTAASAEISQEAASS